MRSAEEGQFTTHDGVPLFYRRWPAAAVPPRGAVLLFHRGHEHGGRMAHLVDELDLPDFDGYQSWLVAEREQTRRLHAQVLQALVQRTEHAPERALTYASAWIRVRAQPPWELGQRVTEVD